MGNSFDQDRGYLGFIDEIKVWSTFTPTNFEAHARRGSVLSCAQPRVEQAPSLISCWCMDESFFSLGSAETGTKC
jgi:hypothetical protein